MAQATHGMTPTPRLRSDSYLAVTGHPGIFPCLGSISASNMTPVPHCTGCQPWMDVSAQRCLVRIWDKPKSHKTVRTAISRPLSHVICIQAYIEQPVVVMRRDEGDRRLRALLRPNREQSVTKLTQTLRL